jgi:hypothetical protein
MWALINRSMIINQINSDDQMYLLFVGLKISLVALLVTALFGGSLILDKFGWFQFGLIVAATNFATRQSNYES